MIVLDLLSFTGFGYAARLCFSGFSAITHHFLVLKRFGAFDGFILCFRLYSVAWKLYSNSFILAQVIFRAQVHSSFLHLIILPFATTSSSSSNFIDCITFNYWFYFLHDHGSEKLLNLGFPHLNFLVSSLFDAQSEVAVMLAIIRRQKARRSDNCRMWLKKFLSLFQRYLPVL